MQDEQQQKALAETFDKILKGYYYDFRKDTVYLLTIFDKSEKDNISDIELRELLKIIE